MNHNQTYRPVPGVGQISVAEGSVPKISTQWQLRDYLGAIAVRLDINRMNYAINPGLYAVGEPDKDSPVLVSANYKLSFDVLRRQLEGLNVWLLVIDTKGVNVWCAAGKGTFGTMEIVKRVMITGLEKIVTTRKLIIPQLGAPGISAHMVQAFCGFSVVYGPVRANDIKKYLAAGMKADPQMRRVNFGVIDRLTVSWLEIALAIKAAILITLVLTGIVVLTSSVPGLAVLRQEARLLPVLFWGAVLSGTVLNAILLPYLPGRAFSFKGGVLGAVVCSLIILVSGQALAATTWVSLLLTLAGISAYLALNFTGASTYTSLSGVKKEIRYSIPVIAGMVFCGVLLEIAHLVWLRRLL